MLLEVLKRDLGRRWKMGNWFGLESGKRYNLVLLYEVSGLVTVDDARHVVPETRGASALPSIRLKK
jgi:hypothetical protein